MKSIAVVLLLATGLCAYTICGFAASATMGGYMLTSTDYSISFPTHTAVFEGKARCVTLDKSPILPGQSRLDSLTADKIRVEASQGKKATLKHVLADGGVTIDGRRSDVRKDQPTVIQNIHAVAKTATVENMDKIVLSGDVVITITEPGVDEPVYTTSGDEMTFLVKDGHIKVVGQPSKPAMISMPIKEKEKSKTTPK